MVERGGYLPGGGIYLGVDLPGVVFTWGGIPGPGEHASMNIVMVGF